MPNLGSILLAIASSAFFASGCLPSHPQPVGANGQRITPWSGYKPGSAVVLAGDDHFSPDQSLHFELTYTLVAATPDQVTVRADLCVSSGQNRSDPNTTSTTYTAPVVDEIEIGEFSNGTKEITASGRTFRCQPVKGCVDLFCCGSGECMMYRCDGVPGGVVGFDATDPSDNHFEMRLKSMTIK